MLRSDRLTTGPAVEIFERAMAEFVSAPHAVACSSGTAALHIAALALGLEPDDHVVVPTNTFVATANAIRFVGAEVIFADVDPDNGLMGAEELSIALRNNADKKIKAVFPVHFAGQPADPIEISAIAREKGLSVVEDASHALGTIYGKKESFSVGGSRHADMTTFSFHPVKTIACGEGGMVMTRNSHLYNRLKLFRDHGIRRGWHIIGSGTGDEGQMPWYYEMSEIGFNYRLSDIHAALGTSQLKRIFTFLTQRKNIVARYDRLLEPLSPLIQPISRVSSADCGWHLYPVMIDFKAVGKTRGNLMAELQDRGVGTQVHYIPVHQQPYYRDRYAVASLPGAESYYQRTLSLPLHAAMTDKDVDCVVEALSATCF